MSNKSMSITALVLAIISFVIAVIFVVTAPSEGNRMSNEDLLSGSTLRGMMNEAKMSPGLGEGYAKDHPTYAWLFDGSFVTYVEGEQND